MATRDPYRDEEDQEARGPLDFGSALERRRRQQEGGGRGGGPLDFGSALELRRRGSSQRREPPPEPEPSRPDTTRQEPEEEGGGGLGALVDQVAGALEQGAQAVGLVDEEREEPLLADETPSIGGTPDEAFTGPESDLVTMEDFESRGEPVRDLEAQASVRERGALQEAFAEELGQEVDDQGIKRTPGGSLYDARPAAPTQIGRTGEDAGGGNLIQLAPGAGPGEPMTEEERQRPGVVDVLTEEEQMAAGEELRDRRSAYGQDRPLGVLPTRGEREQIGRQLMESGMATGIGLMELLTTGDGEGPRLASMYGGPGEADTGMGEEGLPEQALEDLRATREELRDFYGEPETTGEQVAGGIALFTGEMAQFIAPEAALSRLGVLSRLDDLPKLERVARQIGREVAFGAPVDAMIAASDEENSMAGFAKKLVQAAEEQGATMQAQEGQEFGFGPLADRLEEIASTPWKRAIFDATLGSVLAAGAVFGLEQIGRAADATENGSRELGEQILRESRIRAVSEQYSAGGPLETMHVRADRLDELSPQQIANLSQQLRSRIAEARARGITANAEVRDLKRLARAVQEGGRRVNIGGPADDAAAGAVTGARRGPEEVRPDIPGVDEAQADLQRALLERIDELEAEATTDPRTGLSNLRGEERALEQRPPPEGRERVQLEMDLDNFKAVNDRRGLRAGDRYIEKLAEILQQVAREEDAVSLARIGGDEFRITMDVRQGTDVEGLRQALNERVNAELAERGMDQVDEVPLGATFFRPGEKAAAKAEAGRSIPRHELEGDVPERRPPPVEGLEPPDARQAAARAAAQGDVETIRRAQSTLTSQGDRGARPAVDAEVGPRGEMPSADVFALQRGDIELDPQRFQYKTTGRQARGEALAQVEEWDYTKAGVMSVWWDEDAGTWYVVNGHNRMGLAQDVLPEDAPVNVMELHVDTPAEARAVGAAQNIAEGRGSAIDAAKYFRDTGIGREKIREHNIPLTENKVQKGLALANLPQAVFDDVVQRRIKVNRGVILGESELPEEAVLAIHQSEDINDLNQGELEELIRLARSSGTREVTQETLFGTEAFQESNLMERVKLQRRVRRQLKRDKTIFGPLSRQERADAIQQKGVGQVDPEEAEKLATEAGRFEEVFQKLSTTSGRVVDILNEHADAVARGDATISEAADDATEEVRGALRDIIDEGDLDRELRRGEPEAGAEPGAGGAGDAGADVPAAERGAAGPGVERGEPESPGGGPGRAEGAAPEGGAGEPISSDLAAAIDRGEVRRDLPGDRQVVKLPNGRLVGMHEGRVVTSSGEPGAEMFTNARQAHHATVSAAAMSRDATPPEAVQRGLQTVTGAEDRTARQALESWAQYAEHRGMDSYNMSSKREGLEEVYERIGQPGDMEDVLALVDNRVARGSRTAGDELAGWFRAMKQRVGPEAAEPLQQDVPVQRVKAQIEAEAEGKAYTEELVPAKQDVADLLEERGWDEDVPIEDIRQVVGRTQEGIESLSDRQLRARYVSPVRRTRENLLEARAGEEAAEEGPEGADDLELFETPNPEPQRVADFEEARATVTWESPEDANEVAEDVSQLSLDFAQGTIDGVPASSRRLRAVQRGAQKRAWTDIRGQQVQGAGSLHRVLYPFRHPKAERFHFLMLDEDGEILAHTMETSGAIDYVRFANDFAWRAHHRAQRVGADEIVIAHNHPSGDTNPSTADEMFLKHFRRELRALEELPEVRRQVAKSPSADLDVPEGVRAPDAHMIARERAKMAEEISTTEPSGPRQRTADRAYVINHDEVSELIWRDGLPANRIQTSTYNVEGVHTRGADWTQVTGRKLTGPDRVKDLLGNESRPRQIDVLYMSTQNEALALEPHRVDALDNAEEWLPQRAQSLAAKNAVIVAHMEKAGVEEIMNPYKRALLAAKAIHADPQINTRVQDIMLLDPETKAYLSARERIGEWIPPEETSREARTVFERGLPENEEVTVAAVRHPPTGRTWQGTSHFEAMEKVPDDVPLGELEDGFMTTEGRYVGRREAMDLENAAGSDATGFQGIGITAEDVRRSPGQAARERLQRAKEEWGTTDNPFEVGYVTRDGAKLDFSLKDEGGAPGVRAEDHRAINAVFDEGFDSSFEPVLRFLADGNIRVSASSRGLSMDFSTTLTRDQVAGLEDMVRQMQEASPAAHFMLDIEVRDPSTGEVRSQMVEPLEGPNDIGAQVRTALRKAEEAGYDPHNVRGLSQGRGGPEPTPELQVTDDEVLAPKTYPAAPEEIATESANHVRQVARALKEADPEAVDEAAELMSQRIPPGAKLIPVPDSDGSTEANRILANALAQRVNGQVEDVLGRVPTESSYARRRAGDTGLPADEIETRLNGDPGDLEDAYLVDNVVATGATTTSARRALGEDVPALAYAKSSSVDLQRQMEEAARSGEDPGRVVRETDDAYSARRDRAEEAKRAFQEEGGQPQFVRQDIKKPVPQDVAETFPRSRDELEELRQQGRRPIIERFFFHVTGEDQIRNVEAGDVIWLAQEQPVSRQGNVFLIDKSQLNLELLEPGVNRYALYAGRIPESAWAPVAAARQGTVRQAGVDEVLEAAERIDRARGRPSPQVREAPGRFEEIRGVDDPPPELPREMREGATFAERSKMRREYVQDVLEYVGRQVPGDLEQLNRPLLLQGRGDTRYFLLTPGVEGYDQGPVRLTRYARDAEGGNVVPVGHRAFDSPREAVEKLARLPSEITGRVYSRGEEGVPAVFERERLGQGDMFRGSDAPAEGGEQFSMGLDDEQFTEFLQGLNEAETQARRSVERLQDAVDDGTATQEELVEYNEAIKLLRRNHPVQTDELIARARQEALTEPPRPEAEGQQDLFGPESGRAAPKLLKQIAAQGVGGTVGAALDEENPWRGAAYGAILAGGLVALPRAWTDVMAGRKQGMEERIQEAAENAARGEPPGAPRYRGPGNMTEEDLERAVNFEKFDTDPTGEERLQEEIRRVGAESGVKAPHETVSMDEAAELAQRLGLNPDDVLPQTAERMTGVELTALGNIVMDNIRKSTEILEALNHPALTREQEEVLLRNLRNRENQNNFLLEKILRGRSQKGRDLAHLKNVAVGTRGPDGQLQPEPFYIQAKRYLGDEAFTTEHAAKINKFIAEDDIEGLAEYVSSLRTASLREKLVTWWKASIMSAPITQIRNIAGNTTMAVLETAKDPAAWMGDRLLSLAFDTGLRTKSTPRPSELASSSWRGIKKGAREAEKILRTGVRMDDAAIKYDLTRSEVDFDNVLADVFTKTIFRGMMAGDRLFKGVAFVRSLDEMARATAMNEGLERGTQAFKERVAELVKAPTDEMAAQAIHDAEIATFTNRNVLGDIGVNIKRQVPLMEAVIPFTNTPANIALRTVDYTPFGFLRTAAGAFELTKAVAKGIDDAAKRKEVLEIQRRVADNFGRNVMGSLGVAYVGYKLAENGLMTGSWPSDRETQREWQMRGIPAHGVYIPEGTPGVPESMQGSWGTIENISPWGNIMAFGANLYDIANNPETSGALDVITGAGTSIATTVSEQSFLTGLSDALSAIQNPERASGDAFRRTLVSFLIPNVLKKVFEGTHETIQTGETMGEEFGQNLPEAMQRGPLEAPAVTDVFGQEIETTGGIGKSLFDPFNIRRDRALEDEVVAEVSRVEASIPELQRDEGETLEEYRQRKRRVGQQIYQGIQELMAMGPYKAIPQVAEQSIEANPQLRGRLDADEFSRQMQRDLIEELVSSIKRGASRREQVEEALEQIESRQEEGMVPGGGR